MAWKAACVRPIGGVPCRLPSGGPDVEGAKPLRGLLRRTEPLRGVSGGRDAPRELFGVVSGCLPVHGDLGG